jgi:hypothetical protein
MKDRRINPSRDDCDDELQKIRAILLDLHLRIDKLEKSRAHPSLSSSSSDSSIASIEAD